jgi:hypothetical protein
MILADIGLAGASWALAAAPADPVAAAGCLH